MSEQTRIRVFCVDDHPLLREGVAAIINHQPDMEWAGEAATGCEAIQKYQQRQPDLTLPDVTLPDVTLPDVTLPDVTLPDVTLPDVTLPDVTLPDVTLPDVTLPDVTLMDLRLPDMSGIDALIAIRADFPEARIIMLTTFEGDVEVQRALAAGARGYLLKSMPPQEMVAAIRQVYAGKKAIPAALAAQLAEHLGEESLTPREIEVLQHISAGNRNRDIAEQLFITEETVKVHVKHRMEKLGAADRTQAVAIGVRRGIIQL